MISYKLISPRNLDSELSSIKTESECITNGGVWKIKEAATCIKGGQYLPSIVGTDSCKTIAWTDGYCTVNNAKTTDNQNVCEAAKGSWNDGYCTVDNAKTTDTQTVCEAAKGFWEDGSCFVDDDNTIEVSEIVCKAPKGTWTPGSCSVGGSPTTDTETVCKSPKGTWTPGSCSATEIKQNDNQECSGTATFTAATYECVESDVSLSLYNKISYFALFLAIFYI